ncbi:MAG: phosphomethylpyrimidine synthase ThiC [Deltaproteobacteria bacterium]|nr:phosphomethylpyrimidine synthase ThiC [Deltaproteobacteria bacterium]
MTQIEAARSGRVTEEVRAAAHQEGISADLLSREIASGHAVICANKNRKDRIPLAIGKGLSTKVNANIGTSRDMLDKGLEIQKAKVAIEAGAHTVMDLSTGGDLAGIRHAIMDVIHVPMGTVPIYEACARAVGKRKSFVELETDEIFEVIEEHALQGVDFVTVHCGVNRKAAAAMEGEGRVLDVVSRGGALTIEWMEFNKAENPLFAHFDRLLDIARKHDLILSLGDGFRPGCLADATDRSQITELVTLGELASRAMDAGVQVIIEGPGHVPLDQVQENIRLQKSLCHGAPFYVLGPLVTDVAAGWDHIAGAIGGALAAWAGADFLCYVTPAEHLKLPDEYDVREGVIASVIAAHAGDLAKGVKGAWERDLAMASARKSLDWETQIKSALDPEKSRRFRESNPPREDEGTCTMCGAFCAIRAVERAKKIREE